MRRKKSAVTLRLWPTSVESRTRFQMEGTLPTHLPAHALHQLLSQLIYWSGRPMHAVLAVDDQAGWCEVWADALGAAPEPLLSIEFKVRGTADEDRGE